MYPDVTLWGVCPRTQTQQVHVSGEGQPLPLPVFDERLLGSVGLPLHPRHPAVVEYLQVPAEAASGLYVPVEDVRRLVQISMKTDAVFVVFMAFMC